VEVNEARRGRSWCKTLLLSQHPQKKLGGKVTQYVNYLPSLLLYSYRILTLALHNSITKLPSQAQRWHLAAGPTISQLSLLRTNSLPTHSRSTLLQTAWSPMWPAQTIALAPRAQKADPRRLYTRNLLWTVRQKNIKNVNTSIHDSFRVFGRLAKVSRQVLQTPRQGCHFHSFLSFLSNFNTLYGPSHPYRSLLEFSALRLIQ
jgi:hypothetical protein